MAFDPLFSGSEPGTHIRGRTALHLWESLERDLAAALHITVVLGVDVVTMTCQGPALYSYVSVLGRPRE